MEDEEDFDLGLSPLLLPPNTSEAERDELVDVAKALYEALREDHADAFFGEFEEDGRVTIDGRFRLLWVAHALRLKLHL